MQREPVGPNLRSMGGSTKSKSELLRAAELPSSTRIAPRRALDHQSNRLYDVWSGGRHLVLKEYLKPDEWAEAPVREYRALEALASFDVAPKPVLLQLEPAGTNPFVIYEFMEGAMWERRTPTSAELGRLAAVWLTVNRVPITGLPASRGHHGRLPRFLSGLDAPIHAYEEWVEAEFLDGREAAEQVRAALDRIQPAVRELERSEPVLCFCRADARFANVIERPDGRLGMVDWEDSGIQDPARDVADLMTHANQEDLVSDQLWEAFIEPYVRERGAVDPTLRERIRAYLVLFPVWWLSILLNAALHRPDGNIGPGWLVNGVPVERRLQRYLARCFAGPDAEIDSQLSQIASLRFFPSVAGR